MKPSEHRDLPGWHPDRPIRERIILGMTWTVLMTALITIGVGILIVLRGIL